MVAPLVLPLQTVPPSAFPVGPSSGIGEVDPRLGKSKIRGSVAGDPERECEEA